MLLLVLAVAGTFAGPVPVQGKTVNAGDFPLDMQRANRSVFAELEIIISPEGKTESCDVLSYTGDKAFAGRVCKLVTNKGVWVASSDVEGQPVYGRVRTSMTFVIPSSRMGKQVQQAKLAPDLDIPLPEDWHGSDEINVPLAVFVNENGKAESCKLQPATPPQEEAQDLAAMACQGIEQKSFGPISTKNGPIQRYVTTQLVTFSRREP
jgi:hypothetical protein